MPEKEASFGYRTVAWLLGFNRSTVQRFYRIKGWQVRKRRIGIRPPTERVWRPAKITSSAIST